MSFLKNKDIFIETDDVGNFYYSNKHNQLHRINGPAIEYSNGKKSFYVKGKLLNENQFKKLQNKIMNKPNKITKKELVSLIREAIGEYRTKGALGKKNPARIGTVKSGAKKANTVEVYYEDPSGSMKPVADGLNSISGVKFDFITSTWPRTKAFLEKELMASLGDAALSARIGQSVYDELENAKMNELDDLLTVDNNVIVFYLENNELKARTEAFAVEVYYEYPSGSMKPVAGPNSISGAEFDFITSTWPRTKSFLKKELMTSLGDAALSARIGQSVYDELEKAKMNSRQSLLTVDNNVIVFYLENNELKARTEGSVNEELIGNQKVLDKTGDGKLTAKDFELLRKSKK